jgi:hypothetical protein
VVARKPLSESTVANNVLQWGTGGLNIEVSRIATNDKTGWDGGGSWWSDEVKSTKGWTSEGLGRFPANIILDETTAEELDNTSRFFYVAKASKRDRNEGLDGLELKSHSEWPQSLVEGAKRGAAPSANFHPTVKPTSLMEYLVRLVTPEGGTVLDPFTGSGSTGKAALLNGFKFIGCELTEEYMPIIEARLTWAAANIEKHQADKVADATKKATKASKVPGNTSAKDTGASLTALDAAEVALQQIANKRAQEGDNVKS